MAFSKSKSPHFSLGKYPGIFKEEYLVHNHSHYKQMEPTAEL